ncbi:hypothetical protein ACFL1F_01160, partial [Chlamydiota bacterium]
LTPVQFEEVGGEVAIIGSAKDNVSVEDGETVISQFQSYTIEYKKEGEETWTELITSTTPVDNSVLGVFDARYMPKGIYTIRLRVTDGVDEAVVSRIISVVPKSVFAETGTNEYYPVYSPDGTKIAYMSDASGNYDIWVRNADGSGDPVQVTTHTAKEYYPSWSPDGTQILFTTERGSEPYEIWGKNSDGSGNAWQILGSYRPYGADWSPGGGWIAYSLYNNNWYPYIGKADGSGSYKISADHPVYLPRWSPDEKYVVYQRSSNLYLKEVDGDGDGFPDMNGEEIALTTEGYGYECGRFSPDGERIVYRSTYGGSRNIWVMDVDGTNREQITYNKDADVEYDFPCFSPDGTKITYHSTQSGDCDIYIVDYRGAGDAAPIAQITAPLPFTETLGDITITGTVGDNISVGDNVTILSSFDNYILDWCLEDESSTWTQISSGTESKQNEFLANVDFYELPTGRVSIRLSAFDSEGDSTADKVYFDVEAGIFNVNVSGGYYNPLLGDITITAESSENSSWSIAIINDTGQTSRTLTPPDGANMSINWDGTDDGGFQALDGTYTIRILAISNEDGKSAYPYDVALIVDSTTPTAQITAPADQEEGWETVTITGTATDINFESYTVEYGEGASPTAWTTITTSNTPVTNDILATWDTRSAGIANGTHTIKLTVTDQTGIKKSIQTTIQLRNMRITSASASPDSFNPHNGEECTVFYSIDLESNVTIKVYNANNPDTPVKTLLNGAVRPAGENQDPWDGTATGGSIADEGSYYFDVVATYTGSTETAESLQTNSIWIDSADSVAVITSPADQADLYGSVIIRGTATDDNFNSYTVEYGAGSAPVSWMTITTSAEQVESDTLATWDTRADVLDNGLYTIRLTVIDEAGKESTAGVTVQVANVHITNISTDTLKINPIDSETCQISYTIDINATVSVSILNSNDEVVKILTDSELIFAGDNNIMWDGTDSNDQIVETHFYKYIITASIPNGSTDTYAPVYSPQLVSFDSFSADLQFDPIIGEVSLFSYSCSTPAYIVIWIEAPLYSLTNVRNLVIKPQMPGTYSSYWDGHNESGKIVTGEFSYLSDSKTLPENCIIVDTDFDLITDSSAEARTIIPAYDQISSIYFTLTENAKITIKIFDPNGNYFNTILNEADATAGENIQEWNGTADNGGLITTEGYYRVEITAEKPESNYSEKVYTSVKVFK